MKIEDYIHQCQKRIELTLEKTLPLSNKEPRELHKAMRYAVLNGGKRIRPAFVFAVGEALDANKKILDIAAAAIEMVHTASLIHDDLPAIDDDNLRRGKPTCHKIFGEATAILAGDALLFYAFELIAKLDRKYILPEMVIKMISLLAHAIGSQGLTGGEILDLRIENQKLSSKKLEKIYKLKTSSLLEASVLFGALSANCKDKKILDNLTKFSEYMGLAFQIHDDIIGIRSDTKTLGKTHGLDIKKNKAIYPVLIGMNRAKQKENMLYQRGLKFLDKTSIEAAKLKAMASYIIKRIY